MKEKRSITKAVKRILGLFLAVAITVTMVPAKSVEAATSSAREQFKQGLIQMIMNVDESTHNVYQYGLSVSEVTSVFQEIKQAESTKWMVAAYYSNLSVGYTKKSKTVNEIKLNNVDTDVAARYKRLEANVSKIKSGIEPKMTDIDKVMYLHDSIVELASYKYVAYQSYGAGGVLGDKIGVCSGYTKALNLLLEDQGIKAIYMSSDAIDHGWTAVYLDGQWYHVDSTWDDTRSSKSGLTSHKFLLRNDKEFVTGDNNSHVSWAPWNYSGTVTSTSTKYSDWYVHDIVGKMAFEDGYWYYVDAKTNSIMQNTATGGTAKVILNGNGRSAITLVDATSAGITYKQDGTTKIVGYTGETDRDAVDVEDSNVEGTQVTVYLKEDGGSSYTSAGTATIKEAKTSKNSEFVTNNILSLPDLSKYVEENESVNWTAITQSGSGRLFLRGTIVEAEEKKEEAISVVTPESKAAPMPAPKEEVKEEPVVQATVSATFSLKRPGDTTYFSVGKGMLYRVETGTNSQSIAANIGVLPDLTGVLNDGEYIVWTKVSKSSSGKITVRGEIRK